MTTTTATKTKKAATEFVPAPTSASASQATTLTRSGLKDALGDVLLAVTGKSLPVLSHVLLQAEDGTLTEISGTDLTVGIARAIEANVPQAWSLTVPAKLFSDIVGALPGDQIELWLNAPTVLHIKCGRFETNIHGFEASEFPALPSVTGAEAHLSGEVFASSVKRTAFAAATDDTRPVLTGVLLRLEGKTATFAAADGFRLVQIQADMPEAVERKVEAIIPAKGLEAIAGVVKGAEGITVTVGFNAVSVRAPGVYAVARLVEGKYPDIARVISPSRTTRYTANVDDLKVAAKLASYFAGGKAVRLTVEGATLTLAAAEAEVGDQKAPIVGTEPEGERTARIAMNVKFLAETLAAVPTVAVYVDFNGERSPLVLRPANDAKEVFIIMPMTA